MENTMKTTITTAGLDFGNSHTKFSKGPVKICFESGYAMYSSTTGDADEMEYDGRFYLFGKRAQVEYDKCSSERMMLCTLRCLAEYLDTAGADPAQVQFVSLGVDIPINLFGTQREAYTRYYAGKLRTVKFRGKEWKIQFEQVKAFPQGVVAWMANSDQYSQYETVVVLDIGGRTVDVAVIAKDQNTGKPRFLKRFSLQNGILNLVSDIDKELQVRGIQLNELQIESLIGGSSLAHRRLHQVQEIVSNYRNEYVDAIVNSMYENGVDADLPFILVGGGASLVNVQLGSRLYVIKNTGNMSNAEACEKALASSRNA